jgi:hypothetical protein
MMRTSRLKKTTFFLILIPVICLGQSFEQMNNLYQQKKMPELQQLVTSSNNESNEILFFKTIFNENGEESIRIYETLFPSAKGDFKSLVASKISEYYYAKGFYVKASEYAKYVIPSPEGPASSAPKTNVVAVETNKIYYIQVGAFGYRDNANRMKDLLKEKKVNSDVKVRQVNGKTLYCVWVHGDKTYNATQAYAEELKNKYKLNYQIINP